MSGWSLLVDPIRAALFALAHLTGGSLGAAILLLSVLVRLALLPLGVRLAREARRTQARLRALEPELQRLRARFAADPARLLVETRRLQERHGIRLVSRGALVSAAVQLPVGAGLLGAIASGVGRGGRFLWIADLARPDALLAAATAATAAVAMAVAPGAPGGGSSSRAAALVAGALSLFFVWRMAAGVGLYWAASSAVGVVQSLAVRRLARRDEARSGER